MGLYTKRANELSVGQWVVSKFQSVFSLVIMLKLFDAPWWLYIISVPIIMFIMWTIGYVFVSTGNWASFNRETFKGSLYKGDNNG